MLKILIIEDSNSQRKIICKFIDQTKYKIYEAANGKIGLEMITEHQPDLIFCDLVMPEVDGIEVLKVLNDKKSRIPVVVLTSDIQLPVREQCLELGAIEFINKPASEIKIQKALEKVFASS